MDSLWFPNSVTHIFSDLLIMYVWSRTLFYFSFFFILMHKILNLSLKSLCFSGKSFLNTQAKFLPFFIYFFYWSLFLDSEPLYQELHLLHDIILIYNILKAMIYTSKWYSDYISEEPTKQLFFSVYWFEWVYLYNLA